MEILQIWKTTDKEWENEIQMLHAMVTRSVTHNGLTQVLYSGSLPTVIQFSCEIAKYGKVLISIFQQFFASINKKKLFWEGHSALSYNSMDFLDFPDFS